ncbi:MAG: ferritin-like domain-containing protein [Sandaracinaceae bacterium]|nr:ferritin-like domain-containing protein [Sandaracinaceae bacterium]
MAYSRPDMQLRATNANEASWRELADDALARPEAHLERLYELAARDQWTVAGLDWSAIDLSLVPAPLRQTAADLFAQLHFGELTAMSAAARLMAHLDDPAARLVCATQINDEARHARFFANLIARLGCEGRVRPSTEAMMREVAEHETPEGTMLGMQLLIEGAAHSLFLEGARAMSALEGRSRRSSRRRGPWCASGSRCSSAATRAATSPSGSPTCGRACRRSMGRGATPSRPSSRAGARCCSSPRASPTSSTASGSTACASAHAASRI